MNIELRISDPKPGEKVVLLCCRVSDLPEAYVPSDAHDCRGCGCAVWASRSVVAGMLEQGALIEYTCIGCAL